jgi:preprotein translocase subunit SecA
VPGSAFDGLSAAQLAVCQFACQAVRQAYELKISFEQPEALKSVERYTILNAVDKLWQEHLYGMDSLRESIGLRAYGQRDPLIEYKAEAFKVFEELMVNIKTEICHNIFRSASSMMAFDKFIRSLPQRPVHESVDSFGAPANATAAPPSAPGAKKASDVVTEASEAVSKAKPVRAGPKVGRNDPCPCGSGKKYKHCCGKNG